MPRVRKPADPRFGACAALSLPGAVGASYELLAALFRSSTLGVAICDRQFRFRAINDALASMNGLPAADHLGKTLHNVLGSAAEKILPAYEHVFATGQPLSNFEVSAKLPSREAPGHWNESYFPIRNEAGEVSHVGAVVLELTTRKDIQASLLTLVGKLTAIRSAFRSQPAEMIDENGDTPGGFDSGLFSRSVRLLESCLSDTRVISQLLSAAPLWSTSHAFATAGPSGFVPRQAKEGPQRGNTFPLECADPLSEREREIAALLAGGKANKQIACMLTISTRTVESHRARIMLKLDLHSISDLVRYALRNNLIQP